MTHCPWLFILPLLQGWVHFQRRNYDSAVREYRKAYQVDEVSEWWSVWVLRLLRFSSKV